MPYFGGKSPVANGKLGPWIAGMLPRRKWYVEPFAGMAGVLLSRTPPFGWEVLNDVDGRIVAWWTAVRDHADEFARLVEATPSSRRVFEAAAKRMDDATDSMQQALAVHVVLRDGIMNALGRTTTQSGAGRGYAGLRDGPGSRGFGRREIRRLADRLRDVHLEDQDCCQLLERIAPRAKAVVYCDPPYRDADTTNYGVDAFDRGRFAELVTGAKAFVAISGYGDEWDHLGFVRHEREAYAVARASRTSMESRRRVEVLWTNGETAREPSMFAD